MSPETAVAETAEGDTIKAGPEPVVYEKARTPEETEALKIKLGLKEKVDGSMPRASVAITIAGKEYIFGDLCDHVARETITPIMAIQKMQSGGGGALIESINVICDFFGRFHEATWDDRKNRSLYHQGVLHKDRKEINEAEPIEIIEAFHDVAEMLTDPFVERGFLARDPEAEERYQGFLKSIHTLS